MGDPSSFVETFVGGLAEENTLREARGHLSKEKKSRRGRRSGGGRDR